VTLPCEVDIFIFDNDWVCSVGVVVECKAGMRVVAGSIFLVEVIENLSLHSKELTGSSQGKM